MDTSSPWQTETIEGAAIGVAARVKPRLLVLIYTNPLYLPPTLDGARILSEYFDVHMICRRMGGLSRELPAGVKVKWMGARRSVAEVKAAHPAAKLGEYVAFVRAARKAVRRTRPAVVYAYDAHAFTAAMFAGTASRRIPVVFQAHELPELEKLTATSLQTWVIKYALRATPYASAVVFPERYRARCWLEAARDDRPAIIVPNCASKTFFAKPTEWETVIHDRWTRRTALYMGSMSAENGHLEAVRALGRTSADVRLELIGLVSPEFTDEMMRIAGGVGVADRVTCRGFVEDHQRLAIASEASLGLCLYKPVSRSWEFNASATLKLFEYAALGLPVVVPDRLSYREFLKDEDWVAYADVEDPVSIANAIDWVLEDRSRYFRMSMSAREAFEHRLNYEQVFQPLLERVLRLAANGQQGSLATRRPRGGGRNPSVLPQ